MPTKLIASPQARAALAKTRARLDPPHQANDSAVIEPPPTHPSIPSATIEPAPTPAPTAEKTRSQQASELLVVLRERWPLTFCEPRRPFAVGIDKEIRGLLGGETSKRTLRLVMHQWTRHPDYLAALARGEPRINLDGSEAGVPTEDERLHGAQRLEELQQVFRNTLETYKARQAERFRLGLEAYEARRAEAIRRQAEAFQNYVARAADQMAEER
jgi:sRNA-binding protein